jgi:pSer/pThr/pTyr-binding forkhead associated (FHA) protein
VAERELTTGRFIIGRTPDNDLQIDSKYISRHHAQIITSVHGSVVEDLNSTNGIYVRAKRVRRRMLNDGDVVQIGQHEVMYFDERLSRTRALPGDIEDDAVPLAQGKQAGHETEDDDDEPAAPMPIRADRK